MCVTLLLMCLCFSVCGKCANDYILFCFKCVDDSVFHFALNVSVLNAFTLLKCVSEYNFALNVSNYDSTPNVPSFLVLT